MQNDDKIQGLIILFIVNIIVLASAVVLSDITYAQYTSELHDKTLDEIKKHSKSALFTVGDLPTSMGVNSDRTTIYVANSGNDTVSVIDGSSNTKIGDIKVGDGPAAIGVYSDRIYNQTKSGF